MLSLYSSLSHEYIAGYLPFLVLNQVKINVIIILEGWFNFRLMNNVIDALTQANFRSFKQLKSFKGKGMDIFKDKKRAQVILRISFIYSANTGRANDSL